MARIGKTHLFFANTDALCGKAAFRYAYASVSEYRRKKADRLLRDEDKRLSLGAELLLGEALKRCGIVIPSPEFKTNEYSKPYIAGYEDIRFNLSHSGNYAVCAVSDDDIGCDIEKKTPVDLNIAKRFFTPSEYAAVAEAENEDEKLCMFFRLWTLKESFIKAVGTGFHTSPDSFEITVCGKISIKQALFPGDFGFKSFDIPCGYILSVCTRTSLPETAEEISLIKSI